MPRTTREILGIEKQMVRDFNARKTNRLLGHFHPRVTGFSSTRQERIEGRTAMRKTFEYYHHASPHMRFAIARPRVQELGDSAVATFTWTVELGTGRPRHTIRGRGTHVFARSGKKWLIVHEHFSRAH
jgi:ketosteroid isomerase-like protein